MATDENDENVPVCPQCGTSFLTTNPRKVYCSSKCNKNAYIKRRYKRDAKFNERIRNCWQEYGLNKCPKCDRLKRTTEAVCRFCRKIDDKIDIHSMVGDSESLFGSPESLLKMEIVMTADSHPEITPEQLFEMFKGVEGNINDERLKEIIKEVLQW